ncbi:competence protein ComM [Abditibacteriota bacterium]|nr:competence protein ComM [Abditibacteriota bacterium]
MKDSGIRSNAHMNSKALQQVCEMDSGTKDMLKAAIAQFNLTGRGYDRILKVSRTIADLEGVPNVEMHHVAEAINYRSFDRKLFG